jgi:hypothetical protein
VAAIGQGKLFGTKQGLPKGRSVWGPTGSGTARRVQGGVLEWRRVAEFGLAAVPPVERQRLPLVVDDHR